MQSPKSPVVLIVGPTAVGKTQMAVELSGIFPEIEVISADSRQIFREMDIGTAKPDKIELGSVPHHFINIKAPDETYNAGEFGTKGRVCFYQLAEQKKNPLIVGGSGLYIQSLVDGLFEGDVELSNVDIKNILCDRADRQGLDKLYHELKKLDSETAKTIHQNDRQRILRALEVWYITGEPISKLRKKLKPEINLQPIIIGLNRNREKLYEIIDNRVDSMIQQGLIEEVTMLKARGYHAKLQSQKTVGYQEIHNFLDGIMSKHEAIELIKRNSRRFAKRQLTWFNRDQRIKWFSIDRLSEWKLSVRYLTQVIVKLASNN